MALFGKRHTTAQTATAQTDGPIRAVLAPVTGRVVTLADVGDGVFSQGILGPGAGIVPERGEVRAPVSGVLATAFPTGHAYGVRSDDGVEVLVHVGLDTVELAGRGFAPTATQGQRVTVGDLLGTFDIHTLQAAGKDVTTLVVVTGTPQPTDVVPVDGGTEVTVGDPLLVLAGPADAA